VGVVERATAVLGDLGGAAGVDGERSRMDGGRFRRDRWKFMDASPRTDSRGVAPRSTTNSVAHATSLPRRRAAIVGAVHILVVEDSQRVVDTVSDALLGWGHTVVVAGGVRAADEAFQACRFDVAIVDIGLPDGSGLAWCQSARQSGSDVPMLLLTARTSITDRVAGLDAGADDYLVKPFSSDELAARVRALGRRGPRWVDSVRSFESFVIDRDRRMLTIAGKRIPVTSREFDIVAFLAWREGRVVPRDELLESLWGVASERSAASLEVLLVRIRRKLADHGLRDALRTVRQMGYAWALERSKPG
jgi:DNA-binding response OmpR family regulator